MTPRPLYRWKSFWLGVFVVCFIAWAWRDSLRFESWMTWPPVTASNGSGAVCVSYDSRGTASLKLPDWNRFHFGAPYFEVKIPAFPSPRGIRGGGRDLQDVLLESLSLSQEASEAAKTFPAMLEESFVVRPREDWLLFIPHWLILLGFLVLWSGFLFWKWRRTRRPTGSAEFRALLKMQ